MKKFSKKINKFFQERYGMDELGKMIIMTSVVIYIIGVLGKSPYILSVALVGVFYELYRMMSKLRWERREENRGYMRYVKLWKRRYRERKHSRIYMCKSCGRFIRVPKGKGKIQVTCPTCGYKTIYRT